MFRPNTEAVRITLEQFLPSPGQVFCHEEIHLGAADKLRHKHVLRVFIKLDRGADLFNIPATQNNDLVRQGHRFDLIMGDVDHGCPQPAVQPGDFNPCLDPQGCIKVG
ncbi:MAG: Uncharacterised protein [SAR116 cluster bacterium MED-G04]|nr:MAG: Uncharacterised protein [SAR116 cluster bacterium MED-G04]